MVNFRLIYDWNKRIRKPFSFLSLYVVQFLLEGHPKDLRDCATLKKYLENARERQIIYIKVQSFKVLPKTIFTFKVK